MKNTVVIKGNKSGMTVILGSQKQRMKRCFWTLPPSLKRAPDSGDLYR